jgi:prenyl protein peptidase
MNAIEAFGLCGIYSFCFVSSVYLFSPSHLDRDHPLVIQRRSLTVGCMTLFICRWTYWINPTIVFIRKDESLLDLLDTILTVAALFLGPLVPVIKTAFMRKKVLDYDPENVWIYIRNYLMGPMYEELVFRQCFLGILTLAKVSNAYIILISPMFFGLAHVHHVNYTL